MRHLTFLTNKNNEAGHNLFYIIKGILLVLFFPFNATANNIQISNVTLTADTTLSFEISWENSWRVSTAAPHNHDAVWIFVKYKDCASSVWNHMDLSTSTADHVAASPLEIHLDNKDSTTYNILFKPHFGILFVN